MKTTTLTTRRDLSAGHVLPTPVGSTPRHHLFGMMRMPCSGATINAARRWSVGMIAAHSIGGTGGWRHRSCRFMPRTSDPRSAAAAPQAGRCGSWERDVMTAITGTPRGRGAAVWLGVLIALAGVVLLAWPGPTTVVLVRWLGLAIVVYGVHELVNAFGGGGGSRVWSGIIGVVAIIGGLSIFLTPIISAITVGLVIGWYWLIGGVIGIVGALIEPGNRLIRLLVAVVSLLAGVAVIAQPGLSLVTLVWFSGAWMVAAGLIMVASALFAGRGRTVAATT
jgi:uncharacterized membrane protein HdeD (DUF308 family)